MQTNGYRRMLFPLSGSNTVIMLPNLGAVQHRFISRTILSSDAPDKRFYIVALDFRNDGVDRTTSLRLVGSDDHVHYLGEFHHDYAQTGVLRILEPDGTQTSDAVTGYIELDIIAPRDNGFEPLRAVLEAVTR